jgi:DNA-binding GntR family transcriptional regulator
MAAVAGRKSEQDQGVAGDDESRLQPSTLADQAARRLQEMITDGELKEGSRLVIGQLARSFGISPSPLREALARLNALGLLEYDANRGYRVASRLTPDELRGLFEARLVLETSALRFGLPVAKATLVPQLRRINDALAHSVVGKRFVTYREALELNDEFHLLLLGSSGNRRLARAYELLNYGPGVARELSGRGLLGLDILVAEHEAIIRAIEAGDHAQAVAALAHHIADGYARLAQTSGYAAEPLRSFAG